MHRFYIDYLRAVSIIAVITIHVTATFYTRPDEISQTGWWIANVLNTASRFSVPLFIMISGAVLLGRPITTDVFYKTRAKRLIPPFLLWNIFYITLNSLRTKDIESTVIHAILNGYGEVHLWYLTMFGCLMLFAPFINKFLNGCKPNNTDLFTLATVFLLFFFVNGASSISKHWNISVDWFKTFPWYIAYFILGYFIDTHGNKIKLHRRTIAALITLLTIVGFSANHYALTILQIKSDFFIMNNAGALVFILSFLVFLFAKKSQHELRNKNKFVAKISEMSFGMYLIHPIFLLLLTRALPEYNSKPEFYIPTAIILTTLLSYITTALLRRSTLMRKFC